MLFFFRSGQVFDVPDHLTPVVAPATAPTEVSHGFRLLQDFTNFQVAAITAGQGITGYMNGIVPPANLDSQFYKQGIALSEYRTDITAFNLTLSTSLNAATAAGALSPWGLKAILSLPETYDQTTKPVFQKYFQVVGTSVVTNGVYGGTEEDVLAWYSCIWKGMCCQVELEEPMIHRAHRSLLTFGIQLT